MEKQHFRSRALISEQTFISDPSNGSVFSSLFVLLFSLLVLVPSLPRTPCSSALSAVAGLSRDYRLAFQNLNTTSMKASSSALKLNAEPRGPLLGRRTNTVARKHPSRSKHAHNKAVASKTHSSISCTSKTFRFCRDPAFPRFYGRPVNNRPVVPLQPLVLRPLKSGVRRPS